ncbi:MAG: response regulator transcription factor [Crocinitomicaceae bacterium]|nr:response regulator transcription factor [Crocinitomicaceae bacterium]
MNILILEDEPLIAHGLKNTLKGLGYNDSVSYGEYGLAAAAIEIIKPDLAFIDIQLKGSESGLQFAEKCKLKSIPFIFLTSFDDHLTINNALNKKPISYLVKPIKESDILVALTLFENLKKDLDVVNIEDGKKMYMIRSKEVLFFESNSPYVKIHLENKVITVRNSLTNILEKFPEYQFTRVNRSCAVSLEKIEFKGINHLIINGIKIPLSKKYSSQS